MRRPACRSRRARSRIGRDHGVGTIVGTIEYMAPEQARGEQVDQRADIYAFGLVLYRCSSAGARGRGRNILRTCRRGMTTAPRRPRDVDDTIPEAVDAIVWRCVQPDPAARFQTTAELVAALGRLDAQGMPLPLPVQLLKSVRFWIAAAAAASRSSPATWLIADRPAPPPPDPVAVLVADFSNTTGEPVFDGLMEQAVTVGIEGASFITALPRPRRRSGSRS